MTERGQKTVDRSVFWSVAGHGLLLILVLIGGISLPRTPPPTQLAIQASVVESPGNRRPKSIPAPRPEPAPPPEPEPIREPKPEPEPRPEPKPEPKPAPVQAPPPKPKPDPAIERQKAEQKKLEQEQKLAKEKALREKQEAERAAEKERQEKAAAERAKAEAEKEKAAREKAEAEKEKAAREAAARDFDRQLEEEERLLAAADSGALANYVSMIRQKVERNWNRPPGATPGIECEVIVTQIPGGEVAAVQTGRCNADEAVRRSIEAAVLRASPLPLPDDPALFERNLRFTFKPEQ